MSTNKRQIRIITTRFPMVLRVCLTHWRHYWAVTSVKVCGGGKARTCANTQYTKSSARANQPRYNWVRINPYIYNGVQYMERDKYFLDWIHRLVKDSYCNTLIIMLYDSKCISFSSPDTS